jgi:hypothetical protein
MGQIRLCGVYAESFTIRRSVMADPNFHQFRTPAENGRTLPAGLVRTP